MLNKQVDFKLFFTVFALIIFGVVMISSVSVYGSARVTQAMVNRGEIEAAYNHFYLLRSMIQMWLWMGILLFLVKIPYMLFEKYAPHIFGGSIFLMILVLIIWTELYGATGWLYLPGLPSIQPVELLKFSTVIFLWYFFKRNYTKLSSFQGGFVPFFGIMFFIFFLLALQPDFGSIMILWPIMVMMFFIAWASVKHLLAFFWLWIILFFWVYSAWKYDPETGKNINSLWYITQRIDNYITDEKELIRNKTINYQTEQWLIAIGSGGFWWLGFGKSIQKFWYLPEVQWDFIFSVIIEELWFFWGIALLLMYGYIWYRWYLISYYSDDLFAKFVSFGITTWILVQAGVNIWVNLNIVPLTGLTLPFVSYGGSSLISLILWLSVLLNISRYVDETKIGKPKKRWFVQHTLHMYD